MPSLFQVKEFGDGTVHIYFCGIRIASVPVLHSRTKLMNEEVVVALETHRQEFNENFNEKVNQLIHLSVNRDLYDNNGAQANVAPVDTNEIGEREHIPIFLSSDDRFAMPMAVTMTSIVANTSSFVDFYILDNSISQKVKDGIAKICEKYKNFSVEYIKIDMALFEKFPKVHLAHSAYCRYLIPAINPMLSSLKVLYLDVDVIVRKDIKHLYNVELDHYPVGAVSIHELDYTNVEMQEHATRLNLQLEEYFNSGVLLIDNKKWKDGGYVQKLFEKTDEIKEVIKFADQDALNVVFAKNYKKLDYKYNSLAYLVDAMPENALLIHWAGRKPWLECGVPFNQIWWEYAALTPFYMDLLKQQGAQICSFIKP